MNKRGQWNVGDAFDLDKANELIDDKMARNMAADLRKHLGADALKPRKPLITGPGAGPGGIPISSGRRKAHGSVSGASSLHGAAVDLATIAKSPAGRSGSKDGDLFSSMAQRLGKLEALNTSLKSELREKSQKIIVLENQNKQLAMAAGDDSIDQIAKLTVERDNYKEQTVEMMKFLQDYGLKWVGGDGGQREGAFDAKAITEELKHQGPSYRTNVPSEIDTEVLTRRIEELNFIAEKQRMQTIAPGMKGFKHLKEVSIFFFANGLMIAGMPFYPYYAKQAQVSCQLLSILKKF